jgi:hypothetical protein
VQADGDCVHLPGAPDGGAHHEHTAADDQHQCCPIPCGVSRYQGVTTTRRALLDHTEIHKFQPGVEHSLIMRPPDGHAVARRAAVKRTTDVAREVGKQVGKQVAKTPHTTEQPRISADASSQGTALSSRQRSLLAVWGSGFESLQSSARSFQLRRRPASTPRRSTHPERPLRTRVACRVPRSVQSFFRTYQGGPKRAAHTAAEARALRSAGAPLRARRTPVGWRNWADDHGPPQNAAA